MRTVIASSLAALMLSTAALAQDATPEPKPLPDAQNTEQNMENMGDSAADTANDAANETMDRAEEATDATTDAAQDAAQTIEEKTENIAGMSDSVYYTASDKTDFYASTLIGSRIYATEENIDGEEVSAEVRKEFDDIGEVNNIVLSRDGTVKAVVLGVGGFLGIGEKDVAIKMSELQFLKEAGADKDEYFLVVNSTKEDLEKAPSFQVSMNQ